jgi:alpha-mannosidase
MHDDADLVTNRITRELGERIWPHAHGETLPLEVTAWHAPGEPVPYAEAVAQTFDPFEVGRHWGTRPWGTTWFRMVADVPAAWSNHTVEALVDLGFVNEGPGFQSEGMVWLNGEPLQGVHPRRTAVPLPAGFSGHLEFYVEAAANPALGPGFAPSPMGSLATVPDRPIYRLRRAQVGVRNDDVDALLLDVDVLLGLLRSLRRDDPRRTHLLRTLESAFNAVDVSDVPGTAAAARQVLAPALAVPARPSTMSVIGVGHAHIDTAWLWPLRETRRKCARTFASATRMMDEYPEYRFVCSQAVQYEWMERDYPELFERIAKKVAEGRFVPVGGMWVEADMNLPGGESLVRQMVAGQRYFESRFGVRCSEVWIPDVFGYPASLPQVFAHGGAQRFVTQKLSWNKQNRFPHSSFWWEGLDGTRVLTHFPPVDTYNAEVTPREMVFTEKNFADHGWSRIGLMPYGFGNGGGGPTREMVERARRMADLDGVPRVALGTTDEFFDALEAEATSPLAPVWRGELYFEMHRGTLTSQIETKLGNRHCERLLREAELWWAAGGALPADVADELDRLWKDVMVQQFHDILPGSSIAWVHDDAEAEFARIGGRLETLIADGLARLALPVADPSAGGTGAVVANAATHDRCEVVDVAGEPVLVTAPGLGIAPLAPLEATDAVTTTDRSMANAAVEVHWDADGSITSVVDRRAQRQLLETGRTIDVELAPDQPVEFDAWDLESWTRGLGAPLDGPAEVRWLRRHPLVAEAQVRRAFGVGSTLTTTIRLRAHSPRVDLEFHIDWQESERLLSLMVPLDVRADTAACDIQFGHVSRPTHGSSPWDAAKFEVCAHRFVDLAEPSFGVAVLNDGRFGHSLFDGGVRVSLLRAARFPDPEADRGEHRVTISLLPHGPGLHDVLAEAAALNLPLRVVAPDGATAAGDPPPAALSPVAPSQEASLQVVEVDHPGVEVDAVKRADRVGGDDGGDLIVRLHEACGDRATFTVRLPQPVTTAQRCNALEEPLDDPTAGLELADGVLTVTLRPFEIATLRLG